MEWYTVQYRNKDGSRAEAEFAAADRVALFKLLAEKQITAISITAGRIGKKRAKKISISSARPNYYVVFAVLFVVIAVLTAFYLQRSSDEEPIKHVVKENRPKAATDVRQPKMSDVKQLVATNSQEELNAVHPLMVGKDPEHWIVIKGRDGKEFLAKRSVPGRRHSKPPIYKNAALNALDALLFKDMADPMIGVRVDDRFKKSFEDALAEGVKINEDDSEEIVLRKRGMIDALSQIQTAIKNGDTIESIVSDAIKERRSLSAFKDQMKQERRAMRENGESEEAIADFEEACNKILKERGAKPLLTKELLLNNLKQKGEEK